MAWHTTGRMVVINSTESPSATSVALMAGAGGREVTVSRPPQAHLTHASRKGSAWSEAWAEAHVVQRTRTERTWRVRTQTNIHNAHARHTHGAYTAHVHSTLAAQTSTQHTHDAARWHTWIRERRTRPAAWVFTHVGIPAAAMHAPGTEHTARGTQ